MLVDTASGRDRVQYGEELIPLIRKLVADYDAARGAESGLNEPSPQQRDK